MDIGIITGHHFNDEFCMNNTNLFLLSLSNHVVEISLQLVNRLQLVPTTVRYLCIITFTLIIYI